MKKFAMSKGFAIMTAMSDVNPYAPPQHDVVLEAMLAEPGGGVWREGKLLVMHKGAVLPDRCVKCNQPAGGGRLKRSLSWHHPALYFLILASIWIYIIVALIVRHTAKIQIGICERHRRKRRNAIATSWLLVVGGLTGIILGGFLSDRAGPTPWFVPTLLIGGVFAFIGGLIYAVVVVPPVAPHKIDKEYVWLKKVDPSYLAELPPITG
jgi:F0F1-type ATP synthase assembly protein I